jgi:hypothetical protein
MAKEPEQSVGAGIPGESGIMVTGLYGPEPLADRLVIRRFEAGMPVRRGPDWVHMYVACADEKADETIEAIRSGIGIPEDATFHTTINPRKISIRNEVVALIPRIQTVPNTSVLIVAKGYETYFTPGQENPIRISRGAHDYDQELREYRELHEAPELAEKRLFVLTHVGTSLGQAVYDRSVQSLTSGFKPDLFVVDKPSYLRYLPKKTSQV